MVIKLSPFLSYWKLLSEITLLCYNLTNKSKLNKCDFCFNQVKLY